MTIKDLARLSGYSLGTVSRVLNNQPNVSDKARAAILAIAEESGFELNESAQLLKQQRYSALDVRDQIIAIFAAKENFLDDVDLNHVTLFRDGLAKYMAERHPALRNSLASGKIGEEEQARLKTHIAHFKQEFLLEHPNKQSEADVEHAAEKTSEPDSTKKKGQE